MTRCSGIAGVAALMAILLSGCAPVPRAPGADALEATRVSFADFAGIRSLLEEQHREGRPVLLNFWATWCVPCVEELPDLGDMAREFTARGPEFIGVSLDAWVIGSEVEVEQKVREALARSGVTYANLIYRGDQDPLLEGFDMPGSIPYSILFDDSGRELMIWIGKVDPPELRRAVEEMRAGSKTDASQTVGRTRVSARRPTPLGIAFSDR